MSATGQAPPHEPLPELLEDGFAEPPISSELEPTFDPLLTYLRICLANRRVLLLAAAYALASSILVAFLIPVRYQSVARLMPPDSLSGSQAALLAGMAARTGGLGGIAADLLGLKTSGALFIGILESETVQDRVIADCDLRSAYGVSKIEDAREKLAEHSGISEDRKSGIVTIAVADHDRRRAAAIARAYVTELDQVVAQVSTSSARRERIFLEERLRDVKRDLDAAALKFSAFASKNTAIDIPTQGKAMVEAAARLQGELIAGESELRGLEKIYTSNNIRVKSLQARVAELREQLEKLGGGDTAEASENPLYPSIRRLPVLGVTYADLYRQTKIEETVYDLLTQQYELAKVQEAKEIPSVKVLDVPLVPTKKSFPPRTVIVSLGTILALTMGIVWVVGRDKWNGIDGRDPRKVFAQQVVSTFKADLPKLSWNGAESNGVSDGAGRSRLARFLHRHGAEIRDECKSGRAS